EIGWVDWSLVDSNVELLRFWTRLIAFRRANRTLWQPEFFTGLPQERGVPDVTWHGTRVSAPGWDDPQARVLACTLGGVEEDPDLQVMMNMYWEPLDFEVPIIDGRRWVWALDTARPGGEDIAEPGIPASKEKAVAGPAYRVEGRSIAILSSRPA